MTVFIFDGVKLAQKIEKGLAKENKKLRKKRVSPTLFSILVGEDKSSERYLSLKKKAADRIGVLLKVENQMSNVKCSEIIKLIRDLNDDRSVHGIMVQLPLPKHFSKKDKDKIINSINPKKDVDGMRDDSPYMTPAVKAVVAAIKEASQLANSSPRVLVVGSRGFVGRKIVKVLKEMGYEVLGADLEEKNLASKTRNADILISATGQEGLIKANMIKKGAIIIDVGAPKGDIEFDEVARKASFITPVPGGIGPVTISYLFKNLIEAAEKLQKRA